MSLPPGGRLERRRARREETKRGRAAARLSAQRSRFLLRAAIVAALVAAVAGIAAAVVVSQRRPDAPAGRAVRLEADCNRAGPTPCPHLDEGARYTKYNSNPPTSGPHWPQPAAWGVYDRPLRVEQLVHNLEHGGIVVYYNCRDCPELVEQLREAIKGSRHTVLVPYYEMPRRVALTAWGYIDEMDSFDEARVLRFIRAHIDRGPEQVP